MSHARERQEIWRTLVEQVRTEYRQLAPAERAWIQARCARIVSLQQELDALFVIGDGQAQCRDCQGDCCALGHNHLTLANLLTFFEQDILLPELDFVATCPLLGPQGCRVSAACRPYNCISFLCDRIEGRLGPEQRDDFYRIEQELRLCYRSFAERYSGGSMSGLLLAARRLEGRPFLQRRTTETTKTGDT